MQQGDARPSGTVTFLFTDIEGSTRRWDADPTQMQADLAAHDDVLRAAIDDQGGWLFKHTGDGVCAAFQTARNAVDAAIAAQRVLGLPVRMGIATGEAEVRGDDYFGPTLNTVARVMAAGHGGQILVAGSAVALLSHVSLIDLGTRRLRDLSTPVPVFQVQADGLRAEFPALRTLDAVVGNLPAHDTRLLGRDDAIAAIVDALDAHRVVTLVGVGGVGKTSLAVQAAATMARNFRDGGWLIEMAAVAGGSAVAGAVASTFMLQPQPGVGWTDVVVQGLADREVLLLIDNCEHVLDDAARLVEALAACSSVKVLVTSRESLAVPGEWVWRVPSLASADAVALFSERAAAGGAELRPDADEHLVIGEICERLDGIPLAIELAAARAHAMSPTQIRDRLTERFRLLTGSRRSIERHQTLRHAVQWSYDLLEPEEQSVLQQISVFAGGFDLDAAAAITERDDYETLDVLGSLVRKSLLLIERSDTDVRYRLLETVRQFAEESLVATGGSEAVRDRHAAYFANRADDARAQYSTEEDRLAAAWVDLEIANLSASFSWAMARQLADPATRIATTIHGIAHNSLRTETFEWPELVLPLARSAQHRRLPSVLVAACDAATGTERGVAFGLEAIALEHDERYEFDPGAFHTSAMALIMIGDVEQALQVVRVGAEHPSDHPIYANLLFLHVLHHMRGAQIAPRVSLAPDAMSEAQTLAAVALLDTSPMPTMRAGGVWVHANLLARSDPAAAIARYQDALDLEPASRTMVETCRAIQLDLIARAGDLETAIAGFTHAVNAWRPGDAYTATTVEMLAKWLARLGYHADAARLAGAVIRGRTEMALADPEVLALREVMGQDAFTAAMDAGALLDREELIELAHRLLAKVRAEGHAS